MILCFSKRPLRVYKKEVNVILSINFSTLFYKDLGDKGSTSFSLPSSASPFLSSYYSSPSCFS